MAKRWTADGLKADHPEWSAEKCARYAAAWNRMDAADREPKIHLPNTDERFSFGREGRTECGRKITARTRMTDDGVEAATCARCKAIRDSWS